MHYSEGRTKFKKIIKLCIHVKSSTVIIRNTDQFSFVPKSIFRRWNHPLKKIRNFLSRGVCPGWWEVSKKEWNKELHSFCTSAKSPQNWVIGLFKFIRNFFIYINVFYYIYVYSFVNKFLFWKILKNVCKKISVFIFFYLKLLIVISTTLSILSWQKLNRRLYFLHYFFLLYLHLFYKFVL